MMECEQSSGQTILDHGIQVWSHLEELQEYLTTPGVELDPRRWKVPGWLSENRDVFVSGLVSRRVWKPYTIFHDCGKPRCLVVDSEGRRHFPDHARVSAEVWRTEISGAFPKDVRKDVEWLIANDMVFHTLSGTEVLQEWLEANRDRPDLIVTLLLTGLAEIHANAQMFGGVDSTSFKIKWKKLSKKGKLVCNWKETMTTRAVR